MLNTKNLLTKILKRINLRVVSTTTSTATTVAANTGAAVITLPAPSSGKVLAIVGYVLTGTANTGCNVYGLWIDGTTPKCAVRNVTAYNASVKVTAYFLVVD